jgi:hypothetical protein
VTYLVFCPAPLLPTDAGLPPIFVRPLSEDIDSYPKCLRISVGAQWQGDYGNRTYRKSGNVLHLTFLNSLSSLLQSSYCGITAVTTQIQIQFVRHRKHISLRYRAQPVNAVWGNSHCLLWEPYGTHSYSPYLTGNTLRLHIHLHPPPSSIPCLPPYHRFPVTFLLYCEDWGSMFHRNTGVYPQHYTVQQRKKKPEDTRIWNFSCSKLRWLRNEDLENRTLLLVRRKLHVSPREVPPHAITRWSWQQGRTHFTPICSLLSPSKHRGNYTYLVPEHSKSAFCPHSVYLCVPYGSHDKQRLFPQTALTCWAL